MKSIKISIIIPVRSITRFLIEENLPAFASQSFKDFEVIVLPNNRSNLPAGRQASEVLLLRKYKFLRIIPTYKISRPAQKRDIGAKYAKGEILAFIDDDAFPQKNWLRNANTVFQKKDVGAVCGPGILPKSALFWERVFDEVLMTKVGSGGFSYRFVKESARYVDDYPSMNFLIKKKLFKKLGGFNSNYWPGEDSKLCEDLVYTLHEKIYYDPSVTIYHHRRDNLYGYLKQHGNYGFHRGAFFAHGDKNSRRITYLIPTFFVLYLCALVFSITSTHNITRLLSFVPLALYSMLLLSLIYSAFKNTNNLKISLSSAIVLFLTHLIYGIRFIQGFFVGLIKKERIYG